MPGLKPAERVLIIAPLGRDAAIMAERLRACGLNADVCDGSIAGYRPDLADTGALVLTEEALELPRVNELFEILKAQPPWSELPLIILTSGGESRRSRQLDSAVAAAGSMALLERPISTETLLRGVEVALRSRRRQYEVRDLLAEQQRRQLELSEAHARTEAELIERRRAEEALARTVREQTALYVFTDKLQRAASLAEIYEYALDAISSALNCQRTSILLLDEARVMRFVAWRGVSVAYRQAVEGHSPWAPDARDPQPVYLSDTGAADFPPTIQAAVDSEHIRAAGFIPLIANSKLIGKFMTYFDTPHAFTVAEQEAGLALARQLGFGIERWRAARALAESEESYRALVEQVKDYAIFRMDTQGCALTWNEGVRRVLGFEEEDFIGREATRLIFTSEDFLAGVPERELREAAETGTASNDRWMRRQDGSRFFASGVTTALRNAAGALVGYTKVLRDITAARESQARLAEAQEQLREHATNLENVVTERTKDLQATNEQLEAFVYSIAHDLRAPLRSVTGYSQLLLEEYAGRLDDHGRHLLQRVHSSSEFMDKLLLDLLAFGRAARAPVELGPVEVRKAWDAALLQCNSQIEQSQAHVDAVLPLPVVMAHEATLGQCLANLLSNSLKFVPAGVAPRVRFWAEPREPIMRLWLEDNGVGIPPDQHQRVFRVFERLQGSRYPGTGIGLSIVRKGVERMGGTVGVESEPGRGSRFWIDLKTA